MKRDDIMKLEAGRDLDELIAQYVMKQFGYLFGVIQHGILKPYSTDISAAWEVVEKLGDIFDEIERANGGKFWVCTVYPKEPTMPYVARGDTAPLAICHAALLAVMEAE